MAEKSFYYDKNVFNIVADIDADGDCILVESVEQLTSTDREELLCIREKIFGKNSPVDAKKSAAKLSQEIWDEVFKGEDEKQNTSTASGEGVEESDKPGDKSGKKDKKEQKEKKKTKADIARETLQEKVTMTQAELAAACGSDTRNTHTMISIMKNPQRTKDPVEILYNKHDKTYTWPSEEGKKAFDARMKEIEEEKKASKKKKEDKKDTEESSEKSE